MSSSLWGCMRSMNERQHVTIPGTVAAVYEDVNKLRLCVIPLLASQQGGVAASQENFAKPPKLTQPGGFSFVFSIGKPPRPRNQRMLRGILLIARPPLLAVMQGGEYARFQFFHTFYDRRQSVTCGTVGVHRASLQFTTR